MLLRRFVAIRGPVAQSLSDRRTNLVGTSEDLTIDAEFIEKGPLSDFLSNSRTIWKLLRLCQKYALLSTTDNIMMCRVAQIHHTYLRRQCYLP